MWYTPDNGWKSCGIVEEAGASGTRTSIEVLREMKFAVGLIPQTSSI